MRVIWFSHLPTVHGGAQLGMLEAVAGLIERGVDVELVGRRPRALFGPARLARHAYASARLARLLTGIRPDVAITNTLTQPTGARARFRPDHTSKACSAFSDRRSSHAVRDG